MIYKVNSNLLFLFLSIVLTNCEGSKDCDDRYVLDRMLFFNSNIEELNNIEIIGYKKGSDFKTIIDTSYAVVKWEETDDYYLIYQGYLNKNIRTNLDYLISIKANSKSCRISEIKVKELICYEGLIFKEYSRSFDGYLVNGEKFACQIIKIFPK